MFVLQHILLNVQYYLGKTSNQRHAHHYHEFPTQRRACALRTTHIYPLNRQRHIELYAHTMAMAMAMASLYRQKEVKQITINRG